MQAYRKFKMAMLDGNYTRASFIADEISLHSPNIGNFLNTVVSYHTDQNTPELISPEDIKNPAMMCIASIFNAEVVLSNAQSSNQNAVVYMNTTNLEPTNISHDKWQHNPAILRSFFVSLAELGATKAMSAVVERWKKNLPKLSKINDGLAQHVGAIFVDLIKTNIQHELLIEILYCLTPDNISAIASTLHDQIGDKRHRDPLYKGMESLFVKFIHSPRCDEIQLYKFMYAIIIGADLSSIPLTNQNTISKKFPDSIRIKILLARGKILSRLDKWTADLQTEVNAILDVASFEEASQVVYEIPFATNSVIDEINILKRMNEISNLASGQQMRSYAQARPGDDIKITFSSTFLHDHGVGHALSSIVPYLKECGIKYDVLYFGEVEPEEDHYAETIKKYADGYQKFTQKQIEENFVDTLTALPEPTDALLDLDGYMYNGSSSFGRTGRWPLVMYWIGHGGKLGLDFYDYVIGDTFVLQEYPLDFGERHLYLPDSFVSWNVDPPSNRISRKSIGIEEDVKLFNCFNHPKKVTVDYLDCLAEINKRVEKSVFFFNNRKWRNTLWNIIEYLGEAGVKQQQIRVGVRLPDKANHFSRLALCDLGLDTFVNNMASGALDLLWSNVPVVSMPGQTYNSRSCGSFNRTIGLSQCNVSSVGEYVDLAVDLANSPAKLAQMKAHLVATKAESSLFNGRLFAEQFSKGIKAAVQRSREGKPPEHMYV